jgi:hypothetical protein
MRVQTARSALEWIENLKQVRVLDGDGPVARDAKEKSGEGHVLSHRCGRE